MKKNIFFIFFCTIFLLQKKVLFSETIFLTEYDYTKENHYLSFSAAGTNSAADTNIAAGTTLNGLDFARTASNSANSTNFSAILYTQIYPDCQIEGMSFSATTKNFIFRAGDITFLGTKSKMSTPSWYTLDALHNAKASEITSTAQSKSFKSAISSSKTNQSIFLQAKIPFENSVKFVPTFTTSFTPSCLKTEDDDISNTSFFLSSVKLPFRFAKKNNLDIGLNYGTNFLEQTDTTWFMKNPYFSSASHSFFSEEISFSNKFFSTYINVLQSETSSSLYKLASRMDIASKIDFTKDFYTTSEARLFLCQEDTSTISGKILKEPLHYALLEKFFFTQNEKTFTLGLLFDSKYAYETGKEYTPFCANFFQTAFKADFFIWNFTLKYKYKWQIYTTKELNNFYDENEVYVGFWTNIFSNEKTSLYLSGNTKFYEQTWSATGKIKFNYDILIKTAQKNMIAPLNFEASLLFQNTYELDKLSYTGKAKFSFLGANIGAKIKKTASSEEAVFELSCSYATKL